MALAFAGIVVVAIVFRGDVSGVFDVDMGDVVADVFPEFPCVLSRPRLGLHAVSVEDGITGVENPFQAGAFFEEFQAVLPAHAAVVHAVFMHGLKVRVGKHFRDFANTMKYFVGSFFVCIGRLETHDANVFGAEPLHARDAAFDFANGDVERVRDFLGPVGDGGAKGVNAETAFFQLGFNDVERFVGDIVEVAFGKAVDFDDAHLNIFPAELLGGVGLGVEFGACFISDTCQNHGSI